MASTTTVRLGRRPASSFTVFVRRWLRPPSRRLDLARYPLPIIPLPPSRRFAMRDVTYWPLSRTQRSLEPPRHARTVILNTCLPPHRLLGVVERPPAPKRATHPFSQTLFTLVTIMGCDLWLVRRLSSSGRLCAALGVTCSRCSRSWPGATQSKRPRSSSRLRRVRGTLICWLQT
jgi:hypothetical protein